MWNERSVSSNYRELFKDLDNKIDHSNSNQVNKLLNNSGLKWNIV